MSGGIAYVLTEDKEAFIASCNKEMVLLEDVVSEADVKRIKRFNCKSLRIYSKF
ncbi:hypothetical protein GCM10020331_062720 [Ectobacillus funiculus]